MAVETRRLTAKGNDEEEEEEEEEEEISFSLSTYHAMFGFWRLYLQTADPSGRAV